MVGPSRPNTSRQTPARAIRQTGQLLLALLVARGAVWAQEAETETPAQPTLRLRIEWGSGEARRWQGTIAVSDGVLARPVALGIEPDEPGSIWVEEGRLSVDESTARLYDGVDVDVEAPLDASLMIALSADDDPQSRTPEQIPLAQLLNRKLKTSLDDRKNVLQVQRVPGDRLRVDTGRESLIYQPGEAIQISVTPAQLAEVANTRIRLEARLVNALDKTEAATEEQECQLDEMGSSPPLEYSLVAPQKEGVYDLELLPTRHRLGLSSPVNGGRRVQLVVLSTDPRLPDSSTELPIETLVEINPANPTWWQRLPSIPMLPALRKPLGSGDAAVWKHSLGDLVQLGASKIEGGWEAYPLPIHKPGEPHIVEIQYPTDVPQLLGISIIEPNEAGIVTPLGLDSGVYLPEETSGGAGKMAVHRLVFWPRTKTPLLRLDGSKVVYGKIRVLGPRHASVAAVIQRDDWQTHSMLPRRFPADGQRSGRLLAGYYDRPFFTNNFGATQSVDPVRKFALTDWRTFYEGGTRLVEYLNYMGHNGLMLTVLADGSALYPSQLVEPTPRYDTGVYFSSGQDAQRKDVVELLFRLFDREGLTLIPSLDFTAPLPALEAARREAPDSGLELVDRLGQPWRGRQPSAACYNPLDQRVQDAMIAVVRELVHRYRNHPSFGGVALQLTADGYAQLPGSDAGFDEQTLARFQEATKVRLPEGESSQASRADLLLGKERAKWLKWRAETLGAFYRRMQIEMAVEKPGLKLYLAGSGLFDRPELARELRPVLARASTKNEEALLAVGIDPKAFVEDDEIVLLRPQRIAPLRSLAAQAVNLEVNLDQQFDRLFAEQPTPAALFYHEPQEGRLETFDAKNPFKGTPSRLVAQPLPGGQHNRRRFVHAVATLDARAMFDGGRLLPLGQEHEMGPLVAAFRGLPDAPFETVEGPSQPVTIRSLSHAGRTYVYLANDSPWQVKVSLNVEKPADCTVRSLYPGRRILAPSGENLSKQTWSVSLEPYDLLSVAFSAENVKVSQPEVSLDGSVATQLDARIQDLTERARVLKEPPPLETLPNGDFEGVTSRGGIAGWELSPAPAAWGTPAPGAEAAIDNGQPHNGQRSIRLSASGGKATLASSPFPAPATGWLSVSVWMRAAEATRAPKITLALEGTLAGKPYRRGYAIPDSEKRFRLTDHWREYTFLFDNLPTLGMSPLRLRFTCEGNGDAWVDDVRMFDLERLESNDLVTLVWLAIERAGTKLEKKEYADCWQLLDGYWPRYLRAFVPLTHEPIANHPRPRRAAPAPVKTGFYDRMKEGLRSLWR
ncbi:MAG TPA: family 10 glycosylhydrolase [Pirellulales bacterium]|nr:family 10 glycosylhydrolase [Pirellulales bacterium]